MTCPRVDCLVGPEPGSPSILDFLQPMKCIPRDGSHGRPQRKLSQTPRWRLTAHRLQYPAKLENIIKKILLQSNPWSQDHWSLNDSKALCPVLSSHAQQVQLQGSGRLPRGQQYRQAGPTHIPGGRVRSCSWTLCFEIGKLLPFNSA